MHDRYKKLKLLMGRHNEAMRKLAHWQRIQVSPFEQWRGEGVIAEKIAERQEVLATVEREIASEMRARLGVRSGELVLLKEAA